MITRYEIELMIDAMNWQYSYFQRKGQYSRAEDFEITKKKLVDFLTKHDKEKKL